ncbi:MAG: proton-conducting transporter membrane subunit [Lautropia sp.]|nr:proton-conducting transporter membrane subunit [Lautropia sp.]
MAKVDPRLPGTPMSWLARTAWCCLPVLVFTLVVMLWRSGTLPLTLAWSWIPALDLPLAFRIDSLSAVMLLLISGVGSAVFVYAAGYLAGHPQQRRLYVLLALFAAAMIGCVTADHLVLLFLFWEATSLLSFLLVGFDHQHESARKSAQQAMLVTGTGGLAMLGGLVWLWQLMGTARIGELLERLPHASPEPAFIAAIGLIVLGAFTKSAQFPFHFWLPNAMSAPTPVSAYLHSATMVKLGVYLLARLDAGMTGFEGWQITLQVMGSLTAAWGMLLALRERDLKRILAWSTVATLGTLVALVGMPGEEAAVAVVTLLVAHSLYKATLFFVAGNIDHAVGTRIIDRLGKLRRSMPWTATAAMLGGLSMAGIPATFGFVAKDALISAKGGEDVVLLMGVANAIFSAVAVAVAAVAAVRVFWQHPGVNETPQEAHEGGAALVVPPLALSLGGLLLGLMPHRLQSLVSGTATAITPGSQPVPAGLSFDPAMIGTALGSVAFTLLAGGLIFLFWDQLHRRFERVVWFLPSGLAGVYQRSLVWIPRLAAASTRALQHGRLSAYMSLLVWVVALCLVLALVTMLSVAGMPALPAWQGAAVGIWVGVSVIVMGALAATMLRARLPMVLAAGLVGYGSAMLFLFAGAPDVAFTQFVVETVLVVVVASVLLALRRAGREQGQVEPRPRWSALLAAVTFASVLCTIVLMVDALPFNAELSRFFGEQSVPAAKGRNVVNVILVDFRALDTLGEVSVIFLALLAAMPLLAVARRASRIQSSVQGRGVR